MPALTMRAFQRSPWLQHLVFLVLALGLALVAQTSSDLYETLMREDGWGEWATFLAFVVAGVLASMQVGRAASRFDSVVLIGLAFFCFFVAGEEISWGQRLIGYRPPDLFLEKNYQQEANLHNLLKNIFDTRWMVLLVALVYGVALPLVGSLWKKMPRVLVPSAAFVPWFLAVAWLEYDYPWSLTGEFAELLLGAAFLADQLERRGRGSARGAGAMGAALLAGSLAVAALIAPVTDAIVYRHAAKQSPRAERELAELETEISSPGVMLSRLFRKRWVHKRIYTAATSGRYLDFGREDYFLDPWNQAYWIAFRRTEKGAGRVLLYSFGPNRRRDCDTNLLKSDAPATADDIVRGDDVGILFEVRASD